MPPFYNKYCDNPQCINEHNRGGKKGPYKGRGKRYCCYDCYVSFLSRSIKSTSITQKSTQLIRKSSELDEYVNILKQIKSTTKPTQKIKINLTPDNESLVLMLSDLHIGKKVVNHKNICIFNTEIAVKYIKKITKNLLKVIHHIQKGSKIDEVVILLLGDIIDNDSIYDSQAHHIDSHIAEQVKTATRVLWELIVEIANIKGIKQVRVATVRGNHGRTTFGHEESNWDNVIYDNLVYINSLYPKKNNIIINTQYTEFNIINVRGHNILLRHHIPNSIDTPSSKAKVSGWSDIHDVDIICSGHWHHPKYWSYNDKPIFYNGSLVGGDDLSERMATQCRPSQVLFGITEKRVPTFIHILSFKDE